MQWEQIAHTIPNVDELSAIERHQFENAIRLAYGANSIGRIVYEAILKPRSHPDAVRYVENVLAQPG